MPKSSMRIYNPTIDLRHLCQPVRNQGPRPTCTAFAVTSCHEVHGTYAKRLSEEFLYRCCKRREDNELEGTYVDIALNNLVNIGQADDMKMPYDPGFSGPILGSPISLRLFRDAKKRKIHRWEEVNPSRVEAKLGSGTPLITVVEVQESFFGVHNTENFIDLPGSISYKDSYHAILIVGLGLDESNSPYFLIRNSWGEQWGLQGYAYMSLSYFQNYQRGVWAIC